MKKEIKIALAEQIIDLVNSFSREIEAERPKFIGTLNKSFGYLGLKKCEIGTPVFEFQDRYIIIMETLEYADKNQPIKAVDIRYYKETLNPFIDFKEAL